MKSVPIFVVGLVFTVAVFVLVANIRVAALFFSLCVLLIVAAGFALPLRGNALSLPFPPIPNDAARPIVNGADIGETFPQVLVYKVEERNLALLFVPTIAMIGLAIWAVKETLAAVPQPDMESARYFGFYASTYLAWALIFVVAGWLNERLLLRKGMATLAFVYPVAGNAKYQYEFFPSDGVRSGGMGTRFSRAPSDTAAPVFYFPGLPDCNKISFAFVYHKFTFLERRHLQPAPAQVQASAS